MNHIALYLLSPSQAREHMSVIAIRELIAKQSLDRELMSHFIDLESGQVNHKYESEYWDYKRDLPDFDDSDAVAELAADVLAFHNSRGGYIVFGITNDFVPLGVHAQLAAAVDSNRINQKLRKYIGTSFYCRYSILTDAVGGAKKTFSALFIRPREGAAVPALCRAPGQKPLFKEGEFFIRAGDSRKRAETTAEYNALYSHPEPEAIVGSHELQRFSPRPGVRLFMGDYKSTGFFGEITRKPLIEQVMEDLLFGKWDIVLLRGVGGVGKTALGIEITRQLSEFSDKFGGIISLSAKSEKLTPFDREDIRSQIISYDQFLYQILKDAEYEGDFPSSIPDKEMLVRRLLHEKNILLFIDNFETIEIKESRIAKFLRELPAGTKTLVTSRHISPLLPALDRETPPLDVEEAKMLSIAEATAQRLDAGMLQRSLPDILDISGNVPLAIKWIISCSKNASHLAQLIEDHRRGRPTLATLCEFCFTFEYNLLTPDAKTVLALFPVFRGAAPTAKELAVASDLDLETVQSVLDELVNFSLVIRDHSTARDEDVYRMLRLTAMYAAAKLKEIGDHERLARRRLKEYYGASIPVIISAAQEMLARGATGVARDYIDEQLLDRDPTNPMGFYLRGQAYEQEMHYTHAIQDYERALSHANSNPELASQIVLRIMSLAKLEPKINKDDFVSILERLYASSPSLKVALALAHALDMQQKPEQARRYYEDLYNQSPIEAPEAWEDAFNVLCRATTSDKGARAALDLVRDAQQRNPASRVVARWERHLREELGVRFAKTPKMSS
jgi:tetratricopeptide (TPR) repeat protein